MGSTRLTRILLASLLLLGAFDVAAAVVHLKARLENAISYQTDAAGLFTYDTDTRSLGWTVPYRGFFFPPIEAKLLGPATPTGPSQLVVAMSFSASPLSGNATLTPEQEADLLGGRLFMTMQDRSVGMAGPLLVIDTNAYHAGFIARYVDANFTLDPSTLQMGWNIRRDGGFPPGYTLMLEGPTHYSYDYSAQSIMPLPQTNPSTGTATLTPAQAAELVNGFWRVSVRVSSNQIDTADLLRPVYPRMTNISTRLEVGQGDAVAIAGFVIDSQTGKHVRIQVRGPSLASNGVANPLADPKFSLVRMSDGKVLANVEGVETYNPYGLPLVSMPDAREPAIATYLNQGAYSVVVSGTGGGTGVALVEIYEETYPTGPLINISTRGNVLQGDSVMIGGFVIDGIEPKTVVVRALGPSLAAYGVSGVLPNPALQLVRMSDSAVIAANEDWQTAANAAELQATSYAPNNPLEPAILLKLAPGAYTAIVSGQDGGTGIAIVEVNAVGKK